MRHSSRLSPLVPSMALSALLALPGGVRGQVPDSLQAPPVVQEQEAVPIDSGPGRVSPRGAFFRSSLVPGWGHAEVGAFARGAFYFTAEAASGLMIFKTHTRITRTRSRLDLRENVVTARLVAEGITDPVAIENALASDPEIEDLRALEATRIGQREDWIALGLFLMLIGGADAYVSAHLADFPTAVVIDPGLTGGMQIGLSLPVNF